MGAPVRTDDGSTPIACGLNSAWRLPPATGRGSRGPVTREAPDTQEPRHQGNQASRLSPNSPWQVARSGASRELTRAALDASSPIDIQAYAGQEGSAFRGEK